MSSSENHPPVKSWVGKALKIVDIVRLVIVNLVFWSSVLIGLVVLFFAFRKEQPVIEKDSVLLIAPGGVVVEEYTVPPFSLEMDQLLGESPREVLLGDIIGSLDRASGDSRISAVLIDGRTFSLQTFSAAQEFRWALQRFRKSGKPVIYYADFMDQLNYLYGSVADEIYLNPMGHLHLRGFAIYQPYFAEGLNRLKVVVNVFRTGEYKSFVEPFTRNGMSDHVREQHSGWLNSLWSDYLNLLADASDKSYDEMTQYANGYLDQVSRSGGDPADAAKAYGLITGKSTWRELQSQLKERYGISSADSSFRSVSFSDYQNQDTPVKTPDSRTKNKIAVIRGTGEIIYGEGYYGSIGSTTFTNLIDQVRNDPDVKAVVVRLDSGGGSAFASEEIRQGLAELRAKGLPVVVSMGDMAASGAYWIALESDWIMGYSTTLTGSIGVFSIVPTFDQTLKHFAGISYDGIGTSPYASGSVPGIPLTEEIRDLYQQEVEYVYSRFLSLLKERRSIPDEQIPDLVGGRIWEGKRAAGNGLIDSLGGYEEAIDKSAELAGLTRDQCEPVIFRPESHIRDGIPLLSLFSLATRLQKNHNWIREIEDYSHDVISGNDPAGISAKVPFIVDWQ